MKDHLLFIAPTYPARSGHGGAMRARVFATVFAEIYDVSLLVLNLWARESRLDPSLRTTFFSVQHFTTAELEKYRMTRSVVNVVDRPVDHIHIYRLQMVHFIRNYLYVRPDQRPLLTLDMDDFESRMYSRFANVYEQRGDVPRAKMLADRASRFSSLERSSLQSFDQVYVCSSSDQLAVSDAYCCGNIFVVPNAVDLPSHEITESVTSIAQILFVGTLDYFPNEDGIRWFCTEVLPIIRTKSERSVSVNIVGSRPSDAVRNLQQIDMVKVAADVPDLASWYSTATMCIAPLRAGGGTRLKILEAMSHKKAVIATSLGAEGLDLLNGVHISIADSSVDFAELCLMLLFNDELRRSIALSGHEWVKNHHSMARTQETNRNCIETARSWPHACLSSAQISI